MLEIESLRKAYAKVKNIDTTYAAKSHADMLTECIVGGTRTKKHTPKYTKRRIKAIAESLAKIPEMRKAKRFCESIAKGKRQLTKESVKKILKLKALTRLIKEEDEGDTENLDPKIQKVKTALINNYKIDKLDLGQLVTGMSEFFKWIMIHGVNEERQIIKPLIGILKDEYLPRLTDVDTEAPGGEEGDGELPDEEEPEEDTSDEIDDEPESEPEEEPEPEEDEDSDEEPEEDEPEEEPEPEEDEDSVEDEE